MKKFALLVMLVVAISCQKEQFDNSPNEYLYGTWGNIHQNGEVIITFEKSGYFSQYTKVVDYEILLEFEFKANSTEIYIYKEDSLLYKNYYQISGDSITFWSDEYRNYVWYKKLN